jgi:hypothetical protein
MLTAATTAGPAAGSMAVSHGRHSVGACARRSEAAWALSVVVLPAHRHPSKRYFADRLEARRVCWQRRFVQIASCSMSRKADLELVGSRRRSHHRLSNNNGTISDTRAACPASLVSKLPELLPDWLRQLQSNAPHLNHQVAALGAASNGRTLRLFPTSVVAGG